MLCSALVRPAPEINVLAVRTDNAWDAREALSGQRFQWSDRNFNANYGGIPKNVTLHITDPLYQTLPLYSHLGTTGVYVYATDFDIAGRSATIHAESEVRFEPRQERKFTYEVTIEDRDGRVVKRFSGGEFTVPPRGRVIARASARVEGLNFWSWGYGYLYTVTTALKVDGKIIDAVRTQTKFAGGSESGPFAPNSAIWIRWPGCTSRPITTRFGAFQPATTDPPR